MNNKKPKAKNVKLERLVGLQNSAEKIKPKNKPLTAKRIGDVLTITVGIDTLQFAIQQNEIDAVANLNEVQGEAGVTTKKKPFKILDAKGFADDFANRCMHEDESGLTEVGRFFDSIGQFVADYGSEHIKYD